ncbi:MAG: FAD binding domain-containing protein [Myxococcota bacterium]
MKPAPFEYADPTSVEAAVALLRERDGEAQVLAGGQSLMPLLNMRLARPALLVDLRRVPGLDTVREADGGLAIGAMATKRQVEELALVAARHPMLRVATRLIGHPQIRNRGTVGGSMAQADPAGEYPALAVALDAELVAVGPNGPRSIPACEFFVGALTTALADDEILTEVRLPRVPDGTGWSFLEIARRPGDFAMAGAATTLTLDRDGACSQARIVVFGVAPRPQRVRVAEEVLQGETPSKKLFERAAECVTRELADPLSDVHASGEYRRDLAGVLVRRGLAEALGRSERAA